MKSQAAINLVFSESSRRIAALCYIYTLSLMVNTLIQRNVRNYLYLKENKTGLSYYRNTSSNKITTCFCFELFQRLISQRVHYAGKTTMELHGHDDVIRLKS